jgi:hypothetical protein
MKATGLTIIARATVQSAIRELKGRNVFGECTRCFQAKGHKQTCIIAKLEFALKEGNRI